MARESQEQVLQAAVPAAASLPVMLSVPTSSTRTRLYGSRGLFLALFVLPLGSPSYDP